MLPCGINITDRVSWLQQEVSKCLSVSFEIERTMPTELSRLMRPAREACAPGYVDDTCDVIVALQP